MHLKTVMLMDVRGFGYLHWTLPASPQLAGWHVIIGDNGSGKSTFVRSIALALVGPDEAPGLRQDWRNWLRGEEDEGLIRVNFRGDDNYDHWRGKGRQLKKFFVSSTLEFGKADDGVVIKKSKRGNAHRTVWGSKSGWFSAAYGPFRRFAGGDKDSEKIFYSHPRLARHLSVFGEDVALSECLLWLQELKFRELEEEGHATSLLKAVTTFVNDSGFLPHGCRIADINSKEVIFRDPQDFLVPVEELSDGFRAILSMTFELIRQLTLAFRTDELFDPNDATKIIVPGVVLIDEVDAHLHPTWQRRVGVWFREHFPNMQFIVTTHSPFVCQAADHGTVFRLPTPGTNEKAGMVTGKDLDRLLYGNVLDAYGTEMFGANIARSEKSLFLSERLAELNQKELSEGLSPEEREEQKQLRSTLPSSAVSAN